MHVELKKWQKVKKDFVTTISREVEGYWSCGDDDDVSTGRNMYLMDRKQLNVMKATGHLDQKEIMKMFNQTTATWLPTTHLVEASFNK